MQTSVNTGSGSVSKATPSIQMTDSFFSYAILQKNFTKMHA